MTLAAEDQRELVTLLAGQRGGGIDQPGDVSVQVHFVAVCGTAVAALTSFLGMRGRGRGGLGGAGGGSLACWPLAHPVPLLIRSWRSG